MFVCFRYLPDEEDTQNLFDVAAAVDNCIDVYKTVCYAANDAPRGYDQLSIERDAVQFQPRHDTSPFRHGTKG